MKDITNLPMHINLGDHQDWRGQIGFADITKNEETEEIEIKIRIMGDASIKFEHMVEIFELKAIGFAGIKRPDTE